MYAPEFSIDTLQSMSECAYECTVCAVYSDICLLIYPNIQCVCVCMSYSCKRPCKFLAESSATCARFFRKKTCMFKLSVQVSCRRR